MSTYFPKNSILFHFFVDNLMKWGDNTGFLIPLAYNKKSPTPEIPGAGLMLHILKPAA